MNHILFTGLVLIAFTVAFIPLKMEKHKANYLLLLLTGCIGIHFAAKLYIFTSVTNPNVTFRMHTAIQLAYGPLLYLFARKKSNPDFTPSKMWYLFIPLIIIITLYICTSLAISVYPKQGIAILRFYNVVVFLPIVISHLIYGLLSPVKNTLRANEILLLKGLKYIFITLFITELCLFIFGNLDPALNPYLRSINYIVLGIVPLLILWFGQPASIISKAANTNEYNSKSFDSEERRLMLHNTRHEEIFSQLETLLQQEQLYKDENLSLEKLAAASGLNRHHISETLNVFAQKSFYQYINEYRIKEVLLQLDSGDKKSARLLAIAYDCGFKTKASFNQYFKKITGTTPSGYKKEKAA